MNTIERYEINESWAHSGHGKCHQGTAPRKVIHKNA